MSLRLPQWKALEVAFASLIAVLNVLMPTLLLLVLGTVSLWLRRLSWLDLGLRRPTSWRQILALGSLLAVAATAYGLWIAHPLVQTITGQVRDFSQFQPVRGNSGMLLFWLAISWSLGAFGEELAFRGYFLNRSLDLFGNRAPGMVAAVLLNAAAFGMLHSSQGLGGILETALDAAIFCTVYLVGRRNLWLTIVMHGIGNSLGLIAMYLGAFGLLP
jgi:membrane protease YdiL (CAAX protease family)